MSDVSDPWKHGAQIARLRRLPLPIRLAALVVIAIVVVANILWSGRKIQKQQSTTVNAENEKKAA